MDDQNNLNQQNQIRRKILVWTPPAIGALALPAHAQMTVCDTIPMLDIGDGAKCETNNQGEILGTATLTLLSSSATTPIDVISITHDASDPNSITLSASSGEITNTDGIEIEWNGPSPAETPCLPETNVNFVVRFTCNQSTESSTYSFNLLEELT